VYPVFVDPGSKRIVGTGKTLKERLADGEASGDPNAWVPPGDEGAPAGCVAVWPVRNDQKLGVWQAVPATLLQLRDQGYTRCAQRGTSWALSYVPTGVRRKIESGEVVVSGADPVSGSAKLARTRDLTRAKTVWKRARHDAGWHGAVVLRDMLGDRVFDFPKSIYAVRDALQPLLCSRPDALVLDFFAGSGTTTHSICLMNQADGGRRSTILVTNNELSKSDANELAESGLTVGSPEWDGRGIFERVTRPRVSAAITGQRPDGSYVELEYEDGSLASEGFPENVTFAELTFEDPNRVELDLSFEAVAPLLWMRAGAAGPVIAERGDDDQAYAITEHYGVLFDSDRWRSFIADLTDSVRTVFIVTDSAATFSQVSAELPTGVDAVRLYENYLTTFRYGGQGT
jgi:adenine-specific DNA-methyltransferase